MNRNFPLSALRDVAVLFPGDFHELGKSVLEAHEACGREAACESRAWSSWHHHMALVALAHLYVTLTKCDLKRDTPELTLDMALSLLQLAFACKTLSIADSQFLVDYHLRRNKIAHDSHEKRWLAEHEALAQQLNLKPAATR